MKRDLSVLTDTVYDLLVIGGGIHGACIAWEAIHRGLSVALIEKSDFGSATSANSLKVIHGGFRYLQNGDIRRVRISRNERDSWLRIAPHLIQPLPVLIPIYGHGLRGKEAFSIAFLMYELIGSRKNEPGDLCRHDLHNRLISRDECLQLLPGIKSHNLTAGAVFYDAQACNTERVILALLQSASGAGACLANYVEAMSFIKEDNRISRVKVRDILSGDPFEIRTNMVVNACGPWLPRVVQWVDGASSDLDNHYAKAINLVFSRLIFKSYAVGISHEVFGPRPSTFLSNINRYLFVIPWRGRSMVGTMYSPFEGNPDELNVGERDVVDFLREVNLCLPFANYRREDVTLVHKGLVPVSKSSKRVQHWKLLRQDRIFDHRRNGTEGLISVLGVKYTTARYMAEKVIDLVFEFRGQEPPASCSSRVPLHGGHIGELGEFVNAEIRDPPFRLREELVRDLIYNYGSAYQEVLKYFDTGGEKDKVLSDRLAVLKAQILFGIRDEMAIKLGDIVFRRTNLGASGPPEDHLLAFCAEVTGEELGWSKVAIERELMQIKSSFSLRELL